MAVELSGLKISSKESSIIVRDQHFAAGDTFRMLLSIRDTDAIRSLCPIQEISHLSTRLVGPDPDAGAFEMKAQNTTTGPVIGFSESGKCMLCLEIEDLVSAGGLCFEVQLRVKMSATNFYYTPKQKLSVANDKATWIVCS